MFSMRDFIKTGFLKAVGNQPDYWIILNAAGYAEKGVLTEDDLADIQAEIDKKNQPVQTVAEIPVTETEEQTDGTTEESEEEATEND